MAIARTLTFAALLRRLRRAAGLSQEELAERAGLSRNGISELERGLKRAPRNDTIARLVDALQLAGAERNAFEAAARGRSGASGVRVLSAPPAMTRPARVALFGREREMVHLSRFLAGDGPPLLLLAGEPGIGKSRLLREAAARARSSGCTVLEGGCQRRGAQPPFAPVLEAVAGQVSSLTLAQLRASLEGASWMVRLLPELVETSVIPTPRWALPPEQERRLMFDAVARYLHNVAGPAGTLVALDDLQWAGTDALELLGTLVLHARSSSGPPLLLLGAYRSTEVPADHLLSHLLADLARDGLAEELSLGPLAPGEARSLVVGMWGDGDVYAGGSAGLIDRLLERAGGVPFYLVSCIRAAQARAESDAQQGLPTGRDADAVPWDAAQSIRQRLALLPAAAAALVCGAAVAGRQVEPAMLEALAAWLGYDASKAAAALEAALHARLLLEEGAGDDAGKASAGGEAASYRFAHDLIREVAAAELGTWRRRTAHLVLAAALEARLSEPERERRAAELAQHFVQGGQIARALPYLERAAEQAQARYAHAEAECLYRELLQHYAQVGRSLDAANAGERLGWVLTVMGRHDEALGVLVPAAHAYQQAGDLDGYARTMAAVGRVHSVNGTVDVGIAELEAVLSFLENEEPVRGAIAVHSMLMNLYWAAGANGKQAATAERAATLAHALGDDRELAWVELMRGMAFVVRGRLHDGVRLLEEALHQVEERRDVENIVMVVSLLAEAYACLGSFGQSHHYNAQGREAAELLGNPIITEYQLYWLGKHAIYTGEWDVARERFNAGCALAQQLPHPALRDAALSYPLLGLGDLCCAQGEVERGRQYLEEALAIARKGFPPRLLRPVQGCLAERELLAGRSEDALGRLAPLLETPEGREGIDATPLLLLLAWAHLEAGNLQLADVTIREALDRCRTGDYQLALVDALRIQALLAIRRQQWGEGSAALHEAIALARAMPYPYAEAKALYVYGLLQAEKGNPDQAHENYEAAKAILNCLGERLYAERIERALECL